MKKILALLLAVLMILSVAACASAPTATENKTETKTEEKAEAKTEAKAEEPAKAEEKKEEAAPAEPAAEPAAAEPAAAEPEVTGVEPDYDWLKGQTIYLELGYKVGGSLDIMLRNLTPIWEKTAGCTFVIENRKGANGQIAAQYVLDADQEETPTILAYTEMYQSNMYATQDPGFGIDDFSLINMQVIDSTTICTLNTLPYKTYQDLIDAMKARPGEIVCAGLAGGAGLIWAKKMKDQYGVDFKIVTYEGGDAMRLALLGGHADFIFGSTAGDLNLGDEALPLCVVGDSRSVIWPDTPCSQEVCPELNLMSSLGSCRVICTTAKFKAEHPERFAALVETYKQAFESEEYQNIIKETGEDTISAYYGPDKSDELQRGVYQLYLENIDVFTAE